MRTLPFRSPPPLSPQPWIGHGRLPGAATPRFCICAEGVERFKELLGKFLLKNINEIYENEYPGDNFNEMFENGFLQDSSFEILEGTYVISKSIA